MNYEFKGRLCDGLFCFLLIIIQPATTFSFNERDAIQINARRGKLMESCLIVKCEENLTCNSDFICHCRSGYKILNNNCVPVAEENEECDKHEDCCGRLLCINGICRRPIPSSDFVTLSKICMGITVTTIVIAVFTTLIKCIIRYDRSRAFESQSRTPTSLHGIRPFQRNEPQVRQFEDEKPPSYEECVRGATGTPSIAPPPYVIATKNVSSTTGFSNNPVPPTVNLSVISQQNSTMPLNPQALYQETNSNVSFTQESEAMHNARNVSTKQS